MSVTLNSTRSPLCSFICLLLLGGLISSCMRIEPDHPYDPDSPPELRAPASLLSAIYTPYASSSFDYSGFQVELQAREYDGLYTRRPSEEGRFRFDGIPPGIYTLSVSGEINGVLFGIESEEVFLPVGSRIEPEFYLIIKLE